MPDVKFSNQYPYTDFHELNLDWVIETVKHWSELVGKTIQSITLTGTTGLVDTYTINYSDGTTTTFTVTNGRGIVSIVMTSVAGLVATYTVTYNDGTTSTFDVTDGRGIVSIEKTATVGLTDTYTITYNDGTESTFDVENGAEAIDATLTLPGYAADAAAVGAALALKQNAADPAGLAENLTPYSPDSGVSQNQPFILQGTGAGNGESVVDTGSYSQIQRKNGNSAGVNQLFPDYPDSTNTIDGVTITAAGGYITLSGTAGADIFNAYELTFTPVSGRKYLIMADAAGTPAASGTTWQWYLSGGGLGLDYEISRKIYTATDNSQVTMRLAVYNGVTVDIKSMMPRVIDLSMWFGSTTSIPAHILSHPEDFGRYYSGSLAANPGQLVNADGSVLTSIGRNVWNERTRNGYYTNAGVFSANANYVANETPIPVIPNTEYYEAITPTLTAGRDIFFYDIEGNFLKKSSFYSNASFITPANCAYINFNFGSAYGTTYKNDFTISLYYSGESGYDQYYPFSVLAQIDTGSEVLRSAGAVADEKAPDGTITRVIENGVPFYGCNWNYTSARSCWLIDSGSKPVIADRIKCAETNALTNIIIPGYTQLTVNEFYNNGANAPDKSYAVGGTGTVYFKDLSISSTSYNGCKTLIESLVGNYEKKTPTTEQGTPFSGASADNFAIDDFGSMYWDVTNGIPQGIKIFYPVDYKAAIDTLLNLVNGDVSKIVTTNTYPPAPTANGTYILKATVSGGTVTYSWVLE